MTTLLKTSYCDMYLILQRELIKQPSDLLSILLRRHYRGQCVPAILDERLIQVLRDCQLFQTWPLETILPDRQAFFTFLQERWPRFVRRHLTKSKQVAEPTASYANSASADLPFDNEWSPLGLPEDYLPLLAPRRSAFIPSGKRIVAHGGISLEELVVPFIQIEERNQ